MKKIVAKDVIKKIKAREEADAKANFTFRLNLKLMEEFKQHCQKNGVSMASVVEELMRALVQET